MKIKTNRNLKQSQHEDKEKNRSTSDVENSSQMEIRQNDDHASAGKKYVLTFICIKSVAQGDADTKQFNSNSNFSLLYCMRQFGRSYGN